MVQALTYKLQKQSSKKNNKIKYFVKENALGWKVHKARPKPKEDKQRKIQWKE